MASPSQSHRSGAPARYGPTPRWGGEPRDPCKIHWPQSHRARYEAEAKALGLSLNEYVIRRMQEQHGLPGPVTEEDRQLAIGA